MGSDGHILYCVRARQADVAPPREVRLRRFEAHATGPRLFCLPPSSSMSSFVRHFQALARTIDEATTPLRWSEADFDDSLYHFLAARMHALHLIAAEPHDGEIIVHGLTSDGRQLLSQATLTDESRQSIRRGLDALNANEL